MYNILFVCLGNICRSPMAEMIFKDMIAKHKAKDFIRCESRATSTEEYGHDMYPKAVEVLHEHGIPVEKNVVSMVKKEDYDKYTYIICMDKANYYDLISIFKGDPEKKVHLLMEFAGRKEEIEDPWYTGRFEEVYDQIEEACMGLLRVLVYSSWQGITK